MSLSHKTHCFDYLQPIKGEIKENISKHVLGRRQCHDFFLIFSSEFSSLVSLAFSKQSISISTAILELFSFNKLYSLRKILVGISRNKKAITYRLLLTA